MSSPKLGLKTPSWPHDPGGGFQQHLSPNPDSSDSGLEEPLFPWRVLEFGLSHL